MNSIKDIWEEEYVIRASETDLFNRLKVSSVFRYIQDAASNHAHNLGVGYYDLLPGGIFWALSWSKLEFLSYPKMGERIKVLTWPKDVYKLYALRDLHLIDGNNNLFCRCATAWLVVNIDSRRIVNPAGLLNGIKKMKDKHAIRDLPRKIDPDPAGEKRFSKRILYGDIDVNMHVNNSNYADYIFDAYPIAFYEENILRSLEMSFKSELKHNDEISIRISPDDEDESVHFLSGEKNDGENVVFTSRLVWDELTAR